MTTKIEYVDDTINCVIGCTKCSIACENCWAVGCVEGLWRKLRKDKYETLTSNGEWTGQVIVDFDAFKKCRTKKPKRFLLSSLGDWLHGSLSTDHIAAILDKMRQYPQHRFYTLTKRPQRWRELGPIPQNVWLGVSVWDQESWFHYGTPNIGTMPLNVKTWVSFEPLLGQVQKIGTSGVNWVVVGCESGPKRRPCNIEWIRSIVSQCKEYHIPLFVKQVNIDGKVSRNPAEWPEDIRIQEKPSD
jgi:protein gp37